MEPFQWFMMVILAVVLLAITKVLLDKNNTEK